MSREHRAGSIPSRIMSPWLSSAFDVMRMSPVSRTILALLGLLAVLAGIALLLDGLLPSRSHGPNPAWLEVAVGCGMGLAGFVMRRIARRLPADASTDA
jgi:hypothetical protein